MTKKTIFISFDGKEFATEKACCEYEMVINDTKDALSALKKIKTMCRVQQSCKNCIFGGVDKDCILTSDIPEYWNFEEIQKRIGD